MKYDWRPCEQETIKILGNICPEGEYRIVSSTVLPHDLLPNSLIQKCPSALIMCSGTGNGRLYYMVNLNRVDSKDGAIDQMPFGLAFDGSNPIPSGTLVQHGDYPGRTTPLPEDFEKCVKELYPLSELPPSKSGTIESLFVESQLSAFNLIVEKIKEAFPSEISDGS